MKSSDPAKITHLHPYAWLWEPLASEPSLLLKSMFGAKAVYLHGQIMFCFMAKDPPWRGILVCTDRERHAALIRDFPKLKPHPVLSKWLYLEDSTDDFDRQAEKLVRLAARRDERIGVTPKASKSRRRGRLPRKGL
jgi:hypothetical protein